MIDALRHFVDSHPRLLVLTGAGCSAPSGIPTYRDDAGEWQPRQPIQHADFVKREAARRRYWARSLAGWPAMANAQPNKAHQALARLEGEGRIHQLITQNVDRLHQKAGHQRVVDLHGRIDQVICLECASLTPRAAMQARLLAMNAIKVKPADRLAPDGDADIEDSLADELKVPDCETCGGVLKPDVVFFGDAVARSVVERLYRTLSEVDGLLVVGSSLTVFSGFRFCREAHRLGLPIAAVNQGKTRADDLLQLKITTDCAALLAEL